MEGINNMKEYTNNVKGVDYIEYKGCNMDVFLSRNNPRLIDDSLVLSSMQQNYRAVLQDISVYRQVKNGEFYTFYIPIKNLSQKLISELAKQNSDNEEFMSLVASVRDFDAINK